MFSTVPHSSWWFFGFGAYWRLIENEKLWNKCDCNSSRFLDYIMLRQWIASIGINIFFFFWKVTWSHISADYVQMSVLSIWCHRIKSDDIRSYTPSAGLAFGGVWLARSTTQSSPWLWPRAFCELLGLTCSLLITWLCSWGPFWGCIWKHHCLHTGEPSQIWFHGLESGVWPFPKALIAWLTIEVYGAIQVLPGFF